MGNTLPNQTASTTPAPKPAPVAEAPEQQTEQQFVTKEEMARAVEEGFRRAQQSAKSRAQAVEARVTALATSIEGLTSTPLNAEQKVKLREQVEAEIDQQNTQEPPEEPTPGFSDGNPVYDWTMETYKLEGVTITQNDPEWAQIKATLDDPQGNIIAYQRTVFKAIEAKRQRTASQSQTADARVISEGQPSGQAPAKSGHQMFKDAHRTT